MQPKPFIEAEGAKIHPSLEPLLIDINKLLPDDENSQLHGTDSLSDITRSLENFGQQIPLLYDPDSSKMVVGSGRLMAAKALGWTKIAAIPFTGTKAAARAFGIADNQTSAKSVWDVDQLRESLLALGDTEFALFEEDDFGLSAFGEPEQVRAAVWVEVAALTPWANNPRFNENAALEVATAIHMHGWGAPIVAQASTGRVIAGHARLQAAKHLISNTWDADEGEWVEREDDWRVDGAPAPGLVPVRYVDVDDATAARMTVGDNKLGEVAVWNDMGLGDLLKVFAEEDGGLTGLGFDPDEADAIMGNWSNPYEGEGEGSSGGSGEIVDNGKSKIVIEVAINLAADISDKITAMLEADGVDFSMKVQ